jgi:hypothetical protein
MGTFIGTSHKEDQSTGISRLLEMTLEGMGELQQQSSTLITTHINMHGFALERSYTTWFYLLTAFSPFSFSKSHFTRFCTASCLQVNTSANSHIPLAYPTLLSLNGYSLNTFHIFHMQYLQKVFTPFAFLSILLCYSLNLKWIQLRFCHWPTHNIP